MYPEWRRRATVCWRDASYRVQCHMAVKMGLALTNGISGMLQGHRLGHERKPDNYKWHGQLSAVKPTCGKEHHDSK